MDKNFVNFWNNNPTTSSSNSINGKPMTTEGANTSSNKQGSGRASDSTQPPTMKRRKKSEEETNSSLSDELDEFRDFLVATGMKMPEGADGAVLRLAIDYVNNLKSKGKQAETYVLV